LMEDLRQKGVVETARIVAGYLTDHLFDLRYRTDTMRWMELDNLKVIGGNKDHGVQYQATKARPFEKLMRQLQLPKESVFVDIGCGKGRTLLLASRYGFKRVAGIEFAPDLCRVARKNIAVYQQRVGQGARIDIVEADAATYRFQDDENVFYLYNPFDEILMKSVLKRITASLHEKPREAILIYNAPVHPHVVEQHSPFKQQAHYNFNGAEFLVFRYGRDSVLSRS
jgi:SAM-dependent methyltransferase